MLASNRSTQTLIQAFKQYMLENLGLRLELRSWKEDKKIPFFLQDLYSLFGVSLLGKPCLVAVPKEPDVGTPVVIKKHILQIETLTGFPCIYLSPSISSYNCQRLAKHGVQFVIPGRRICLPALGINWTERYLRLKNSLTTFSKHLSPSSQAVIIYVMTKFRREFIPLELARILNYTPMTMTRVLNELESFNIGKITRKGKNRLINFAQDSSLIWKQALPFLQNPIKKRIWLKSSKQVLNKLESQGAIAGLSALSEISMLSAPSIQIYAVGLQTWKALQKSQSIQIVPNPDEADIELEVWSYDPILFTKERRIDCFSLYLSLRDSGDERVESALAEILKGAK